MDHYERSFELFGVKRGWAQTLLRWDPDVLLMPRRAALAEVLRLLPADFELRYDDDAYVVFTPGRRGAAH